MANYSFNDSSKTLSHTYITPFLSTWQEMWFRAQRDKSQFNFYNLQAKHTHTQNRFQKQKQHYE